ncbi:short-chain dehydrogenase/reductase SDR [Tolypothrix tenuis PCC 7101]|uniref:Short-chain dehydrogenase/reductase SDR n=1 Tax=Tolypothrix tenuis PCC 7101 TaxID=231146 RepID=A0A1Z4MTR3_9CYAN|nr:3-oxoacyl-ACP reductase FabG [Aulosira sp. FACHB-113]BAY96870.1 short-chain dehydrogenase/reductase SDR [Tolypothrix tenuis PCC 7101]BAZ72622.1 short-chain dehydrogenase/reductase SDR [Aulosira laxa NIES-50]
MNHILKNKRALITGGSRGIGAAIVKRLASEGADVAFTYTSSPDRANEIVQAVQALGVQALAIHADSADAREVVAAVEDTVNKLGSIDILVNNAGVLAIGPIDDFTLADFDRTFAINVRAVFVATQAAVKHMKEGGRIINIGSTNAERMPFAGGGVYAMSKSALQGLVQGLSRDLGPRGITINNVQPGPIATDMNPSEGEFAEILKKQIAVARYGTVDEVAGLVAYLAGPESGYITGANLMIDGGFSA